MWGFGIKVEISQNKFLNNSRVVGNLGRLNASLLWNNSKDSVAVDNWFQFTPLNNKPHKIATITVTS